MPLLSFNNYWASRQIPFIYYFIFGFREEILCVIILTVLELAFVDQVGNELTKISLSWVLSLKAYAACLLYFKYNSNE